MAARKIDGKWYAEFRFQHADGTVERVRKRSPVQSKAGADEFEHQRRSLGFLYLLAARPPRPRFRGVELYRQLVGA